MLQKNSIVAVGELSIKIPALWLCTDILSELMTDAFSHFTTGRLASHIGSDWSCNFEHQDCSLSESECLEHVSIRDIKSYTMIQDKNWQISMAMIYSNDAWLVNSSTWPLWISHLLWPMERITSCWFKFRMLNIFLSSILKVNIQICEPWTFYQFYHNHISILTHHVWTLLPLPSFTLSLLISEEWTL